MASKSRRRIVEDAPARSPLARSAADLKAELEAEGAGQPFLILRDTDAERRMISLSGRSRLSIGRGEGTDLTIRRDPEVSRVHAELELISDEWVVVDEGLSRNGSYVNGRRIVGRRRLDDADLVRFGDTEILFRDPTRAGPAVETAAARGSHERPDVSDTERRILVALCRPLVRGDGAATATNREIADEVFLSVETVKGHLRSLFARFEIAHLPQNQKRAQLAGLAIESGLISPRDMSER